MPTTIVNDTPRRRFPVGRSGRSGTGAPWPLRRPSNPLPAPVRPGRSVALPSPAAAGEGWFVSSLDLRTGLAVVEVFDA